MACAVEDKEQMLESDAEKKIHRLQKWLGRIQRELEELQGKQFVPVEKKDKQVDFMEWL